MSHALRRTLLATWLDMSEDQIKADMRLILGELRQHRETARRVALSAEVHMAARELAALTQDDRSVEDVILTELYYAIDRTKAALAQRADELSTQPRATSGTSRRVSVQAAGNGPRPEHTVPRRSGLAPSAQGTRQPGRRVPVLAGPRPGGSGGIVP